VDANTVTPAAGFSPDFASNFSGTPGWLLPNVDLGNGIVHGGESVVNTPQATDNNHVSATLNKIKGSHSFSVGANYITSVFSSRWPLILSVLRTTKPVTATAWVVFH
jgi:hypothetical protein